MSIRHSAGIAFIIFILMGLSAEFARATSIQDLVRLKGHERNVLVGMGIVIGLDGTGDESKDSLITARPYAQLFANLGNEPLSVEELAASDSYALVQVTMQVQATGSREGDRLDVSVNTLYNAQSLEGGRLIVSLLRLPGPDSTDSIVYAFAEGALIIEGSNPRSATVR
ncbi:MAG: flagellar basal body P-ring protein FlgI, partial [Planctomycetota bacterium]|nr:flagellar basal body P-ring protein FlgI [Planctomycetota bacterium]